MANLARTFVERGLAVARFNFLYTEKKKGPPDRMPRLMECFAAVVESARERVAPQHVFIGGHSMGGRAASMLAADGFACDGLVLLAYPLHPAGQPEKRRDAHLPQIRQPVLCLNGTRDELCEQPLMQEVVEKLPPTWTMHWLEAADHGFHVLKRSGRTDEDVLNEIGDTTREWVSGVVANVGPTPRPSPRNCPGEGCLGEISLSISPLPVVGRGAGVRAGYGGMSTNSTSRRPSSIVKRAREIGRLNRRGPALPGRRPTALPGAPAGRRGGCDRRQPGGCPPRPDRR